jgi:hypothetical protein
MSKCVEKLFNTNDEARCQKIENESGCELKKCSDYDIQNTEIFAFMILKHFVFHLMELIKKKNIVIIKVQILEILFLVTRQKNAFLKVMDVKK